MGTSPALAQNTLLWVIAALLAAALVYMAAALKRSLRRTLYSYRNIGLIGGILYVSVMEAVVFSSLLSARRSAEMTAGELYRAFLGFPRQFSYYAVFFLALVCLLLAVSNVALIRHEGFRPTNALSVLMAVFYIGGTWVVYALADYAQRYSAGRGAVFAVAGTSFTLFILLMLCYFECLFVGAAVTGWLAARQIPDHDRDYIIILGCSVSRSGGLLPLLKGRVNRAIRYAWQQEMDTGIPVRYVPSGGQGADEVISEGSAMELYLLSHGAEDYEVFPEKKSATTLENMCFSKRIIDELKPDARIAFATTNYHMLRSGMLARQAGIEDIQGIAGDTKWYFWPNGFIREFFAILTMARRDHLLFAAVNAAACILVAVAGVRLSLL